MNCTKKEILKLQLAYLELEMRTHERAALRDKAINRQIDVLASVVSLYIEATKSEWSENHQEIKRILDILEDFKSANLTLRADSVFQHQFEQLEAGMSEFKAKIEAMPDDE